MSIGAVLDVTLLVTLLNISNGSEKNKLKNDSVYITVCGPVM
jgi:hypothetical protein